jgi:hypothetical protein
LPVGLPQRAVVESAIFNHQSQITNSLDPLQRALFPDPDVADHQNDEKDEHLDQSEQAEQLELHRPGKKENHLDVEDDEQNSDDVEADGVASTGLAHGRDSALIRHQLRRMRIIRTHQLGQKQRQGNDGQDQQDEDEDGDVILWHALVLGCGSSAISQINS